MTLSQNIASVINNT